MPFEYIDPKLPRKLDEWNSPILGQRMPIVTYGHGGKPLLIFPTAAADYLENERFFLIKSIEPSIKAGRLQVFSIDSINRQAWMDRKLPVAEMARRQALYMRYIEEEVVPFIRWANGNPHARIATTGASFGAFHAMNTLCRRPDLFDVVIAMAGFYDLSGDYFKGYTDNNCYFNNPAWYVPGAKGEQLRLLREACSINIVSGQGAYEAPDCSRRFSQILWDAGIPNSLDLWGFDVNHDWPWWRRMLPYYVQKLGW